ncbi:MAG TPA: hypothetical protein VKX17_17415 [Planctomycetota bacterium]|nr:hypothetical protein [Planctomycetota bacterium]
MSEFLDLALKDRRNVRALTTAPLLLPELRGKRIAWAGVESAEPLQRGCDQSELLERLAADGIRHLIVPLNSGSEDSCIFARKHVDPATVPGGALYDLERRDEGAFTRLKFLLEAAGATGVMVGLSLFDAEPGAAGPFSRGANLQGLTLSHESDARSAGTAGVQPARGIHDSADRLRAILIAAANWVCSAARGFQGVWIEPLRNARGQPGDLERALGGSVAETLARHREDLSPIRLGPWVALRRGVALAEKFAAQAAPFDAESIRFQPGRDAADFGDVLLRMESAAATHTDELYFARAPVHQPALLRFPPGALDASRCDWLWRTFFRGYWPIVSTPMGKSRDPFLWDSIASLARFSVAWAARGALRQCPEILTAFRTASETNAAPFAAEDGAGRHFVYFPQPALSGVALSLPSGFYRHYWIAPSTSRILDRGEGDEGGPHTHLPGCGDAEAKILVIEQDEAPDSLAVL